MTAPRRPRHRLADNLDIPAPAASVEPPTQAMPIVPAQRAAGPQVLPAPPPFAADRAPVWSPGPSGPAPSAGPAPRPDRARRGMLPLVLAGATAVVLALGVAVVVVESGGTTAAAPVSGR